MKESAKGRFFEKFYYPHTFKGVEWSPVCGILGRLPLGSAPKGTLSHTFYEIQDLTALNLLGVNLPIIL